jgi:membrane peptidoglycan carboxypeptidase
LVAVVWLGNDNYYPMSESYGGNIPARIWARFMQGALKNVAKHDFIFPGGEVSKVAACGGSYGKFEYYLTGTEPISPCGRSRPLPSQAPAAAAAAANMPLGSGNMPPAPTFSPEPTAPPPDPTPQP